MNENHSLLSVGSIDGFIPAEESTDDSYSLYTGLRFRHQFLRFGRRKPRFENLGPFLKNIVCALLTNVVVSVIVILSVLGISILLGLIALLCVKPLPVIDFSMKAFSIPNHEVTRYQEAYKVAVEDNRNWHRNVRQRRAVLNAEEVMLHRQQIASDLSSTRFALKSKKMVIDRHKRYAGNPSQYIRRQKVTLVYLAVGGTSDNIFTRERIETIHRVENDIVLIPRFSDFCWKDRRQTGSATECVPPKSLVSKFFYDNNDQLIDDFDGAIRRALSWPDGILYTDGHVNQTYFSSRFLRSEVDFGVPLQGMLCTASFSFSFPGDIFTGWLRNTEQFAKSLLLQRNGSDGLRHARNVNTRCDIYW